MAMFIRRWPGLPLGYSSTGVKYDRNRLL